MRRGQMREDRNTVGFTKQQLMDAGAVSAKVFDSIRKASRINGPPHGGLNWVFSHADVDALILKAKKGTFTDRGAGAAAGWERMLADEGKVVDEGDGDGEG